MTNASFAIVLMGKRELVDLLCLSSWCLMIVVWVFLVVPRACLQFVIVGFPNHTHLLFFENIMENGAIALLDLTLNLNFSNVFLK